MLDRLLQVLNLPGAAVRGAILEANDPQGFDYWKSLWQNQQAASGAELLKRFGLEPENRFAAGAANFATEVALDPLTYLGGGLLRGGLKAGIPFVTKEAPLFGEAFKGVRGLGELGLLQPRPETVTAALNYARQTPVLRNVVGLGEDVGRMVGAVTKLPREFLTEATGLGKRIAAKTVKAANRIGGALRGLTEDEGRLVIDALEDPATRLMHGLPTSRPEGLADEALTELRNLHDGATGVEKTKLQEQLRVATGNQARLKEMQQRYDAVAADPSVVPIPLASHIADAVQVLESELGDIGHAELERGIISKLREHYFPHVKTKEALPVVGAYKPLTTYDPASELRQYVGSIRQMNDEWAAKSGGKFWWDQPGVPATARLIRGIRATETYDFLEKVLAKPEWASSATKLADEAKALGVSAEDLLKQRGLTMWKPPASAKTGLGKTLGAEEFAVSQDMANYMDRVVKAYTDDESIGTFLKWFDKGTGVWKKLVTVYNPAFHVNNWIGNLWNIWLAGFSHPGTFIDAARFLAGQDVRVGKYSGEALRDAVLNHGITSSGLVGSIAREGGGTVGYAKALLGEGTKMERLKQTAESVGGLVENHSRLSLFFDGLAKGMDPEAAAKRVNEYLFDYSGAALSNFEQSIMRRVFPFWQWTRFNVPLQIKELTKQPSKFLAFKRGEEAFQTAFPLTEEEQQNRPEYLRQALPVGRLPGGQPLLFNPRLPLQDLNKLLPFSDTQATGRDVLSSLNPIAQLPIEIATNYDLFTRKPIEQYQGQTVPMRTPLGEVRISPQTNLALTTAGGYPLRASSAIMQALSKDADAVDALRAARLAMPGLYTFEPDQTQVNRLVDERKRLQDMIRKYRAEQGKPVPTVTELRRGSL